MPEIHVKVAVTDTNLAAAADLIRPALLYADSVTLYSPAASMIDSAAAMAELTKPADRLVIMMELIQVNPSLLSGRSLDIDGVQKLVDYLQLDRAGRRRYDAQVGKANIAQIHESIHEFASLWEDELVPAVASSVESFGGQEVIQARRAGALKIAPLAAQSTLSGHDPAGSTEDMFAVFLARLEEMVTDPSSYPLLDAGSAGLARSLVAGQNDCHQRGAEVTAAAGFMGYLPYFGEIPIDELVELRSDLRAPLVRFRSAMVAMSRDFESHPAGDAFQREVEDAWRERIEPALLEIEVTIAEHGWLRGIRLAALKDPKQVVLPAAGALVARFNSLATVPLEAATLTGVGVASGLALASAARDRIETLRETRKNGYYFLHALNKHSRP